MIFIYLADAWWWSCKCGSRLHPNATSCDSLNYNLTSIFGWVEMVVAAAATASGTELTKWKEVIKSRLRFGLIVRLLWIRMLISFSFVFYSFSCERQQNATLSQFFLSLRAEYEFDINSMRWCRWKRNRTTGLSSVIRNEKQNVIIYFVDRFQALAHAISFAERKFTSKDSIFALLNKNRKFRIAEIPNDI